MDQGPWDIPFVRAGGETYTLNQVEHEIIRKRFVEPRIHFALVCAARSCPPLLNVAYRPDRLQAQLESRARGFINDAGKNKLSGDAASVSALFDWFSGDFTKDGTTVVDYINRYAKKTLRSQSLTYEPYDWSLNSQ